jgi:hypothetical protein
MKHKILNVLFTLAFLLSFSLATAAPASALTFTAPELLGRPTDHSVTVNVVADTALEVYFESGTTSGVYTSQTGTATFAANTPIEMVIDGLTSNTQYYYRMRYRQSGTTGEFLARDEHSFWTQRAQGSTFTFTIIADSHMNGGGGNESLYVQTLANVAADHPDFHFDLGDTFWMDGVTTAAVAKQRYLNQRGWMGTVSHSAAIFVMPGNHENEEGWNFDDANSKALLSINARKLYYPNPITDGFYSGNDDTLAAIDDDHLREDYYAWTWGDALFVVIDPFQYTMDNPYATAGGEENDEGPGSGDRWDWTLGEQQFNWFKQTLDDSDAKYKFVFAHHMVGGSQDYVRGGAGPAHMFEWGGYNLDGTTWGFNTRRPGWGDTPIHQLMVANGVSAFFHGHDHEYAYEVRDGVVYQLVPQPGNTGYGFGLYSESDPYTERVLPSPGHLRVTVSPSAATVEYVQTSEGTVAHSYTIEPTTTSTISVDDFANYRVFQRDIGGTSKSVPISGTYSDMDWNRVEARVLQHDTGTVVVGWTTIDTTPGGGTFSGNLVVPQGGWYNIEVRALDGTGSMLGSSRGTNKWGVGMIILCIGQSNMVGNGQPPFTTVTSDLAVNYSNAGIWEHLSDPYDDESPPGAVDNDNSSAGGSMIPALANSLLQTFNFPIAFVPSAKSGSNLHSQWAYRNPSNHYDTSTLYGQSITKAQSVGGVELIIMHQGEADTNDHRTEAQYEADFATMIGNYRQDLYATIPIFICQLGTIELGTNTRTDEDVVAVRNAQHDLDNGANIFMAATAMDQPRLDAVHYTCQGLDAIGGRIAQTIKYYLGAASYYRGPAITSALFVGNRNTVEIQIVHRGGNDITPASGITGFSLLSDGLPVGITSAERISADRIRLTLASVIPQDATAKLSYFWGSDPDTSSIVKDNSSLALPLENTTTEITVTEAVNQPPNQPTLVSPGNGSSGISTNPTLQVTVSDPDADNLNVTFYGRESGTGSGEDFTVIALPDTQLYSQSYPSIFTSQTQWIVNNRSASNIAYVAHEGDIVNTASSTPQWDNADAAMSLLEDPVTTGLTHGIPYGVLPGNHDQPTTNYNNYFGTSRFTGRGYYGGYYGSNNDNNYGLFSAAGMDFIVINLQYNPTTAMLDWADDLLKTYSDRRGIVVTHYILDIDNSWGNESIYTSLKDNPNLFLMLCGHMHSSTDGAAQRTETGDYGNTIYILLADYQDYPSGGNGYLRTMQFSPADDHISVKTYSPYISSYLTDPDNQFVLTYNMPESDNFVQIGTVTGVTSGSNTSINWPGRDPNTTYEWYVEISDGSQSTTGPIWSFVTTTVEPGILGDVNGDGFVNSTDALIVLSCDVGLNTSQFCPMNCGDVNSDGLVNSTDALIILSYDVGIAVPYPVGEPRCPSSVTPCPGCGP